MKTDIWSGRPWIDVLIERLLYPEVSDNSKETAIRRNIEEYGHINSQGLWQHAQDLHKLKSGMTPIWKRGTEYKVPCLTKKCNRTMPNHDQKQNSIKTMVIWTGEISWDLSSLQRITGESWPPREGNSLPQEWAHQQIVESQNVIPKKIHIKPCK